MCDWHNFVMAESLAHMVIKYFERLGLESSPGVIYILMRQDCRVRCKPRSQY